MRLNFNNLAGEYNLSEQLQCITMQCITQFDNLLKLKKAYETVLQPLSFNAESRLNKNSTIKEYMKYTHQRLISACTYQSIVFPQKLR